MSTYILMKVLESTPSRYDKGIRILTLGKLDDTYHRLCNDIQKGQRVIDIGCGTGALTLMGAQKGAFVKGIDINPEMLEIAKKKAKDTGLDNITEFAEMGAAELGNEPSKSYDAAMSCLCFSELSEDEITFTLKEIKRILKPGGRLLVADETNPHNIVKKILHGFVRVFLLMITYILTQTTTKMVKNLPDRLQKEGFIIESVHQNKMENFIEVIARK